MLTDGLNALFRGFLNPAGDALVVFSSDMAVGEEHAFTGQRAMDESRLTVDVGSLDFSFNL